MIQVNDLRVRFGKTAVVDGLSFHVPAGSSLALWGENGAGKTTAIRAILGLLPHGGAVRLAGHELGRDGRRARGSVGYVAQQLAFYDDMTSLGYLSFMGAIRRAPADEPAARLDRVGLGAHAGKAVGALSGGMKQRLALAAALLGDPPILILDEPTANLDRAGRADLLGLLADLRQAGKTLLLTSHRLEEVAALAERALVLDGGRVRLECGAGELATALGQGTALRLVLAPGILDVALVRLVDAGFSVRRNGHGILVRVAADDRAAPVVALLQSGIAVDGLSLEETEWTVT